MTNHCYATVDMGMPLRSTAQLYLLSLASITAFYQYYTLNSELWLAGSGPPTQENSSRLSD